MSSSLQISELIKNTISSILGMYQDAVQSSPALSREMVWCKNCGRSMKVNSVECLKHGWPKCCNQTMTIDSPKERENASEKEKEGEEES
jgi:hypothetical protein